MKNKFIIVFLLTIFSMRAEAQVRLRVDTLLAKLHESSDDYVLVVAHRGDWRNAPENSLFAIKNCIKMGVDMVEIDIRMTKDSVLILMHDATINRTTSGKGSVSAYTWKELQQFCLKDALGMTLEQHIPTLRDVMLLCKGKILVNVDKAADYMDKVQVVLQETETEKQVIYKGRKSYLDVKKQYGDLLDNIIYMPVVNENATDLNTFVDDFIEYYQPLAFEFSYRTEASPVFDQIQEVRKHGCRVWVNALWPKMNAGHNDERAVEGPDACWGWILRQGANIIQTDRPALLLDYLRSKNLHN